MPKNMIHKKCKYEHTIDITSLSFRYKITSMGRHTSKINQLNFSKEILSVDINYSHKNNRNMINYSYKKFEDYYIKY